MALHTTFPGFTHCIRSILLLPLVAMVCEAGKILIMHPVYAGSHVLVLQRLAEELGQRGHQIHILRWRDYHRIPVPANGAIPNVTVELLSVNNSKGEYPYVSHDLEGELRLPLDLIWERGTDMFGLPLNAFKVMDGFCSSLLGNTDLFKRLKGRGFQLAIVDLVYNECSLALAYQLGLPTLGYWAYSFVSGEADYTTAYLPASHIPGAVTELSDKMTFMERVYNHVSKFLIQLVMVTQCYWTNSQIQQYFPNTPYPSELIANLSGVMINSDYCIDYPRLLPPTFVNVGGLQLRPLKGLPPDLKKWIEESDSGVILFTMGFYFDPSVVPKQLLRAFMDAFSRLSQRILVKFESHVDDVPQNVRIMKWVPQQDVLAHPKTKLLMSHCGMHSVMEAIYFKVPMAGMPIFFDQGDAFRKAKDAGIAVGIGKDFNADQIHDALMQVLQNDSYKKNVEHLSSLMQEHNSIQGPLERAVWLTEFLLRTKGAQHLKLSSKDLSNFQYFGLDVAIFLLAILLVIWKILSLSVRKCFYRTEPCRSAKRQVLNNNTVAQPYKNGFIHNKHE